MCYVRESVTISLCFIVKQTQLSISGGCGQWCSGAWRSGYTLNLCPHFFFNGPAKDERPVSYTVTCKVSLAYLVHSKMGTPKVIFAHCHLTSAA